MGRTIGARYTATDASSASAASGGRDEQSRRHPLGPTTRRGPTASGPRQQEFPGIVFRDTPIGRQAFIAGSRLSVWHFALIAPEYDQVADAIAASAGLPTSDVVVALAYAAAYPDEIAAAIADSAALNCRVASLMAARGDAGQVA